MDDFRIAVCIATTGRPDMLNQTLAHVAAQTSKPDNVLICPVEPEDVDRRSVPAGVQTIRYLDFVTGLTSQRNALLRAANDKDLVLFIDDDFLMHSSYIANVIVTMKRFPGAAMLTGHVLADGACGPGLEVGQGRVLLDRACVDATAKITPAFNAYGCNMVVNWRLLRDKNCWFDENLPLYGWQEDVDFSRQAARYGSILKCDALVGVHLGVKAGRVSGVRFGYSQVANQLYLIRKGTIPATVALKKLSENLAANVFGLVFATPNHVDRLGRLKGNIMAFGDALLGRLSPRRILDIVNTAILAHMVRPDVLNGSSDGNV